MTEWKLPWQASCLCGEIQMQVTAPPMVTMACHCRGCQKLTSGPYSLSMLLPAGGFEVVSGEPVLGALKGENQHFYCPSCKTWLFTRPAGMDLVNLRSVLLDDASWVAPIMETGTAARLSFAQTGAEFSFEGFPDPSEYPVIMQAFADHGPRPGE
jgi:hypothetical protein